MLRAAGHLIVLAAVFDLPIRAPISVFEKEREFGERYYQKPSPSHETYLDTIELLAWLWRQQASRQEVVEWDISRRDRLDFHEGDLILTASFDGWSAILL